MKKIYLLLICGALMTGTGCGHKSKSLEGNLPLPPTVDGGILNGQFVQTEYGFGFPVPAKWLYLPLSAEQEVDEVARFLDPLREMIVRVAVQLRDPSQKFSAKTWADMAELDLKNHQFQIKKKESEEEWKTSDSERWMMIAFHMTDAKGGEWTDEEWALVKEDLLIIIHATLPKETADTEKGKKLFKALEGSLTQITWYLPIGTRGISVERYELQHFTGSFCQALESRSASQVGAFFDEMYPDKAKWNIWYQQVTAGDPKTFDLKAELSGLVINGDYATATFTVTRKDKNGSKPIKSDRSFKLSKKEGTWKITASLDKN